MFAASIWELLYTYIYIYMYVCVCAHVCVCVGLVNGLEWELCRSEEKKSLEINSSLPFLEIWKEYNQRTFEGCNTLTNLLRTPLYLIYACGLVGYLLVDGQAGPLSLIDFIEWLRSKY